VLVERHRHDGSRVRAGFGWIAASQRWKAPVAIRFRLRPSPCGIPCSTQRITPLPRASRPGVGRQEDTQSRPV